MDIRSEYDFLMDKLLREGPVSSGARKEIFLKFVDLYIKSVDMLEHDVADRIATYISEEGTSEIREDLQEKVETLSHRKDIIESINSWIVKITDQIAVVVRAEHDFLMKKLFREGPLSSDAKKEILIKLVDVYIKAVNTFEHDVVHGIDICIYEDGTPEILEYLREKKQVLKHEKYIVESIDSWVNKILERSSHRGQQASPR